MADELKLEGQKKVIVSLSNNYILYYILTGNHIARFQIN